MAIANRLIDSGQTTLLTVPAGEQYAILTLIVCNTAVADNTGANDSSFTLYFVPADNSDGSSITIGSQTKIANRVVVAGADSFTFDTEKTVLSAGDRIVVEGDSSPYNLAATVSYLVV